MDAEPNNRPSQQNPGPGGPAKPPGGDRKGGGSFVWYLIGLTVVLLLVVTILGGGSQEQVHWSDLQRLVRASNAADPGHPDAKGWIEIIDRGSDPPKRVRLENISNVVVAPRHVLAEVDRTVLGPVDATSDTPSEAERITIRSARDANDRDFPKLLSEMGISFRNQGEAHWLTQYVPLMVVMVLMLLFLVFIFRRMGGAGSPMAFGRSRGKLYAQEDLEVTFDDVAGIDEAVDELREVVDFLREPQRYQRLGGRIPKGVLLVGPPGTGKTLLGKAVAGEAGVPFYSLSGSDFVEMFVGVGAARVRDMFQQAESKAPCIIFIDELDALGKTRGSGNVGSHDEREQTLNALLVEMDGFGTNSGVIVMGATNRPETLDPALLRPGRFDRHVLVDRPDVAGREKIIEVHLQDIKVDAEVDVKRLAAITSGFVGADLANMVNEAALLAARNGHEAVGIDEFYEAVERASIGLEKKSRIINDEEKLRLAYHEAGHALVSYSLPNTDPVHKVSIIPRGLSALGYVSYRPEHDSFMQTRGQLESRIQEMLGGTLAEELILGDVGTGASNDLQRATETARAMVMDYGMSRLGRVNYREGGGSLFLGGGDDGRAVRRHSEQTAREIDQEVKRIIDEGIDRTKVILERRRPALEAITQELLQHEVIDADRLAEIIEANSPSPMIVPGTDAEPPPTPAAGTSKSTDAETAKR